jgi:DNA polymerase-3 subunit alpha (Gram-positive type)
MYVRVQGNLTINRFDNDMVLEPYHVMEGTKPEARKDTAPEKRVELHLHTRMSTMDALTDIGGAVKRAASWGHPAIAITDHGNLQAFPDAWHAADKAFLPQSDPDAPKQPIKLIYGVEGYMVPDRPAVSGPCDMSFDGSFVAFDLETTGLSRYTDRITEIGAVLVENGEIVAEFNTFADPQRKLDEENIALTGITDDMLVGAPSQEEAIRAFLDFAGDRPLVAHNAAFDMGFLREGCARYGIEFRHVSVDTLILAQKLLPSLSKHKLDVVAKYFRLPEFRHHRASDDAATCGLLLPHFFRKLEEVLAN